MFKDTGRSERSRNSSKLAGPHAVPPKTAKLAARTTHSKAVRPTDYSDVARVEPGDGRCRAATGQRSGRHAHRHRFNRTCSSWRREPRGQQRTLSAGELLALRDADLRASATVTLDRHGRVRPMAAPARWLVSKSPRAA